MIIQRDIPNRTLLEIENDVRAGIPSYAICKRYRIGRELLRLIRANAPRSPEKADGRKNKADDVGAPYVPSIEDV